MLDVVAPVLLCFVLFCFWWRGIWGGVKEDKDHGRIGRQELAG